MENDDESADADNEGTMMYKRKDHSMANFGRKSSRQSQTAKKRNKNRREEQDNDPLSAGEMDENEEDRQRAKLRAEQHAIEVFKKHKDYLG